MSRYKGADEEEDVSGEEEEVVFLDDSFGENIHQDELIGYAKWLGFDTDNDPEFLHLAKEAIIKPLPIGWKRAYLKNSSRMCYYDTKTGEFYLYSPNDEAAMNAYQLAKKMKEKKSTVVPRTKLAPVGSEQKEKKKKKLTKENVLKSVQNKEEKAVSSFKNNMTSGISKDTQFVANEVTKNERKDDFNVSIPKPGVNRQVDDEFSNNNNFGLKKEKDSKNKARRMIEDLEGYDQMNIPPPQINRKNDLDEAEKRKYYNDAIDKLKEIDRELKRECKKKQENHSDKEKKLKLKLEEENRREIEKYSIVVDTDNRRNLKLYEEQLQDENRKILEDMKELHQNAVQLEKDSMKKNFDKLRDEKSNLLKEIETLSNEIRENNSKTNDDKADQLYFNQAKEILEEKFKIDRSNLEKKFKGKEKEAEMEEESQLNFDVDHMKERKVQSSNPSLMEKLDKILEDYQHSLDEEYELTTKTLKAEIDEKVKKELLTIKEGLEAQDKQRIENFKKETDAVESYHLSETKFGPQAVSMRTCSKSLCETFDSYVERIEELKQKLREGADGLIESVFSKLSVSESLRDSANYSKSFEDYLVTISDEQALTFHKKKNKYELLEVEYKEKSLLFEYFVEIGTQLVKIFRSTSDEDQTKPFQTKEELTRKLFALYREKINFFKDLSLKLSGNKLYDLKNIIDVPMYSNSTIINYSLDTKFASMPFQTMRSFQLTPKENFRYSRSPPKTIPFLSSSFNFSPKMTLKSENAFKDVELDLDGILLKESSLPKMQNDVIFKRKLSFDEIISRVNDENRQNFESIENFVRNADECLLFELRQLETDRRMQTNLKNALMNSSYREKSTSRSSKERPYQFIESVRLLEDEKDRVSLKNERLMVKEAAIRRLKMSFEAFKTSISSTVHREVRKNLDTVFREELSYLLREIDEFKRVYNNYII